MEPHSFTMTLTYEHARVYIATLLEAYTDYKIVWRDIQTAVRQVGQGQSDLQVKPTIPGLAEYSREAEVHYNDQLSRWAEKMNLNDETSSESSIDSAISSFDPEKVPARRAPEPVPERPLPPSNLIPYENNLFGLDKASKDCRAEMIRIVKEVDTITNDPKISIDVERLCNYLSPSIFRILLPAVVNIDSRDPSLQDIQPESQNHQDVFNDLTSTKSALALVEERLKKVEDRAMAVEDLRKELDPYGGYCPVPLDIQIRFQSVLTGACLDYVPERDLIHQWETLSDFHQSFIITRASRTGYFIYQTTSNKYLTMGNIGATNRIYTAMRDVGSVFVFEPSDNGSVMIRPADRNQYTMNVEHGERASGTKVIFWPGYKSDCDRWMVHRFSD